jgi:hypothetical protein
VKRAATISDCGRFRLTLTRKWGEGLQLVVIMLNPSTADAERDDPTIRRLIAWARAWGYDGIIVVNLLPIRTSDPREALAWYRALPKNWQESDRQKAAALVNNPLAIYEACRSSRAALVAWGNLPADLTIEADVALGIAVSTLGDHVYCLGRTKHGHPIHPMARGKHRVPDNAELIRFEATSHG